MTSLMLMETLGGSGPPSCATLRPKSRCCPLLVPMTACSLCLQLRWEEIQPTLVRQLGKGSFGHVFEGWYHGAPMAVKVMNVDCCTGIPTSFYTSKCANAAHSSRLTQHACVVLLGSPSMSRWWSWLPYVQAVLQTLVHVVPSLPELSSAMPPTIYSIFNK